MRRSALSIAVLLGIATLAAAEARAMPTVAATVTIENGSTVHVTGKRNWGRHSFHGSSRIHKGFKRHQSFARHHHRHHYRGHPRHDVFVAKRIGKGHFVIVRPAYGRSFGYRHLPARPLIKNGSFARRSYYW